MSANESHAASSRCRMREIRLDEVDVDVLRGIVRPLCGDIRREIDVPDPDALGVWYDNHLIDVHGAIGSEER